MSCSASALQSTRSVLVTIAIFGVFLIAASSFAMKRVTGAELLVRGQAEADHVDLGPGGAHHVVEPLAEQGARLVQPGGVDQDQLGVGPVHDAPHGVPRRLRLVRGDRHLLADQSVREGGLARVGAAHEAGEAGAVGAADDADGSDDWLRTLMAPILPDPKAPAAQASRPRSASPR